MSPIVTTNSSPARRMARTRGAVSSAEPFYSENFTGGTTNPASGCTFTMPLSAYGTISTEYPFAGGTHSARISYEGQTAGNDWGGNTHEINVTFPATQQLGVEFRWRVPSNYVHRNNYFPGPPVTGKSENNKFFQCWASPVPPGNDSNYAQITLETFPEGDTSSNNVADGTSTFNPLVRLSSTSSLTNVLGDGVYADAIGPSAPYPIAPGSDALVRIYIQKESSIGAGDGRFVWIVNGTVCVNTTGAYGTGNAGTAADGFRGCYFMGASNSGYDATTTFYLGDFKFYNVSLSSLGWL